MRALFIFLSSLAYVCGFPSISDVQLEAQESLDRFHVCTVASKRVPGLEKLLSSCTQQGIEIDVLGLDLPFRAHIEKLNYVKQYIDPLPDDHIVLFVDGYDVLFLADKEKILKKFLAFNTPLVVSAERGCYPFTELAISYPKSPTPFKYVNAGGYIGYVGFIKNMLKAMDMNEGICDQGQITKYFFKNNFPFTLDYYSQIFLCLHCGENSDVVIDDQLRSVHCLLTHSDPCIIHDNGYCGAKVYQRAFQRLVFPYSDTKLPMKVQESIVELAGRNPSELSAKEYTQIAETVYSKSPCKMLVFGVGNDAFLWQELNHGGTTIFLEDLDTMVQRDSVAQLEVYEVHYPTKRNRRKKDLWIDLPKVVFEHQWDIILVGGRNGEDPQKQKKVHMAFFLADQNDFSAEVFHCEDLKETDQLHHYKIVKIY